ncbi:XRE family transcriptional regulator [Weissella cibaria]|uniref:XRE family transcriptional regulator n=1 Tax=Weissella cibaria TaxID=137591 RepID=UPI0023080026|nr:XRE family transcriptional regulator [Weissella cibaria]WCE24285.1 XRE family transcriptional regulator [Weissella cibaria]WCE26473.1 XRE family transcriptional regulator [Weissella cibaria]
MAENIQYYLAKNAKAPIDMVRDLEFKQTTVYDWINARTYPRIDKIEMMANYFGIDKSDLVEKRNTDEIHSNNKDDMPVDLEEVLDKLGPTLRFEGKELTDEQKIKLYEMAKLMLGE